MDKTTVEGALHVNLLNRSGTLHVNLLNRSGTLHVNLLNRSGTLHVNLLNRSGTLHVNLLNRSGTQKQSGKLGCFSPTPVLSQNFLPAVSARNLHGVIFDDNYNFRQHISQTCRCCFYHIRDLRRIRRSMTFVVAKTIATALVSSRLDYYVRAYVVCAYVVCTYVVWAYVVCTCAMCMRYVCVRTRVCVCDAQVTHL